MFAVLVAVVIDGACVEIADTIDIVGYVRSSIASTAFKRRAIDWIGNLDDLITFDIPSHSGYRGIEIELDF